MPNIHDSKNQSCTHGGHQVFRLVENSLECLVIVRHLGMQKNSREYMGVAMHSKMQKAIVNA
jgi:hypothetical protein